MQIGIAIKSIRKKLSIRQNELADRCGISQTSLSLIESGIKRPSTKTIKSLCVALEIPESLIYILAMQETDVPDNKKDVYNLIYPSIRSLALQLVSGEHQVLVD